jgi:hypothetical protein
MRSNPLVPSDFNVEHGSQLTGNKPQSSLFKAATTLDPALGPSTLKVAPKPLFLGLTKF